MRVRALWESALESSREPRHQQWIRGSLSRLAAKAGDFEAAGRWLQPCDPQSNELICDTSYRLSYALLATVQSRFNDVILALAPTPDVLPFFFSQRVLCHVIRANAFEKLGDVGTATNQLQALVSADPSLVGILPLMAKANAELDLCPQSMPRALGH